MKVFLLVFLTTLSLSNFASNSCSFSDLEEVVILDEVSALGILNSNCADLQGMTNARGQGALHLASQYDALESIDYLLAQGWSVNNRDSYQRSALFYAESVYAVKALLNAGADVMIRDRYDYTAVTSALDRKNYLVTEVLLMEGARVKPVDLKVAAQTYDIDALELVSDFVQKRDIKGSGRYFKTFYFYNPRYREVARKLVAHGADLNDAYTISSRRSLLDFYVDEYLKGTQNFKKHGTVAIEFLVGYGADANGFMPRKGSTIFHALFWKEDLKTTQKIIKLFLKNGLDINHAFASDSFKSALMKLSFHRHSSHYLRTMTRFLLDNGANPMQRDEQGRTPLHWAIRHANVDVALELIGLSDLTARDDQGLTPREFARKRLAATPIVWEKRALAKIIKAL